MQSHPVHTTCLPEPFVNRNVCWKDIFNVASAERSTAKIKTAEQRSNRHSRLHSQENKQDIYHEKSVVHPKMYSTSCLSKPIRQFTFKRQIKICLMKPFVPPVKVQASMLTMYECSMCLNQWLYVNKSLN